MKTKSSLKTEFPRIVFFGTPPFAASIFRYLIEEQVPILALVTQPDKPQGRSLQQLPPAAKQEALCLAPRLPIYQPEKASDPLFLDELRRLNADLYVVVAFGQILSQTLLDIPPLGCINVHASLLPRYRGAAPIQRALIAGERETGISIQKMVKKLDAGAVLASAPCPIPPDMTKLQLEEELCALAKPLLLDLLRRLAKGPVAATPQDDTLVTFAPKISPEETQINWALPAVALTNLIRALSPKPGAWSWVVVGGEKKRLKILRARVAASPSPATFPTGQGLLELIEVQPEGKNRLLAADWLRGLKTPPLFPSADTI
jgi:methionyl-tRNA formyltransferase